ncbi:hypothetical protein, partial [Aeromonas sp. QDB48]|uniref:hypothetical protein n=1 Tax=Aeromonas sp. QDB48 TaxID=2990492 RepID=UPI0022E33070
AIKSDHNRSHFYIYFNWLLLKILYMSKGMTRWVRWSEYQKLSRTAQLSVYESLLIDEQSIVQKIAS